MKTWASLLACGAVAAMAIVACARPSDEENKITTSTSDDLHNARERSFDVGECTFAGAAPKDSPYAFLAHAAIGVTVATVVSKRAVVGVRITMKSADGAVGSARLPVARTIASAKPEGDEAITFLPTRATDGTFVLGPQTSAVDIVTLVRSDDPLVARVWMARSDAHLTHLALGLGCKLDPKAWSILVDPTCEGLLDGIEMPERCRVSSSPKADASAADAMSDAGDADAAIDAEVDAASPTDAGNDVTAAETDATSAGVVETDVEDGTKAVVLPSIEPPAPPSPEDWPAGPTESAPAARTPTKKEKSDGGCSATPDARAPISSSLLVAIGFALVVRRRRGSRVEEKRS